MWCEKYGADHVAQIITFGTMAARAAVRDVGRALAHRGTRRWTLWPSWCPMELGMTIDKALSAVAGAQEAAMRAMSRCQKAH